MALDMAPESASKQRAIYFANRAACSLRVEDPAGAAHDCSAALDLDPTYVKALLRRSTALEALEDYDRAVEDAKKVLELDPGNAAAASVLPQLEAKAAARREEMQEEMLGKLKDLGNTVLGKFGLSLDNFKTEKDPTTGSYSLKFQQ